MCSESSTTSSQQPATRNSHPASCLVAICVRTRSNEINDLIAAECEHLTGGRPDAEGVAVCQTVEHIHRAAYVRTGLRRIAQAPTFADLLDVLRRTPLDLDDFRVDALYLSGRFPVSQQEAIIAAADAIHCRANLAAPRHRLLLVAQRETFWIGEIQAEATQSYAPHLRKPCHVSSSLEARVARALVNLVVPPAGTLIDPCCGTGSILLEAAALGLPAYGADRNPKMVHMAQLNLLHFGYPPQVVSADARTWTQTAGALVTDLPYGRQLEPVEEDLPDILAQGARLAPLAVYVAGEDIVAQLTAAGYGDVEVLRLVKPNGFTRYVHRARIISA
ncbi:MAG: TRM11 family SAM-dependent methyltransferase [Anaerolineae bacterium]